jgi:energy-coupling factor transporter ATP-binding protein EcfA2
LTHQTGGQTNPPKANFSVNKTMLEKPAVLVLTGASGAGKTTLAIKLDQLAIAGVAAINCDRVKIEFPESGDPSDYQAAILKYWISQVRDDKGQIELAVLDTQIRPHRAREALNRAMVAYSEIVLVDCDPARRNARLRGERGQPELANAQMDCWAAYLRGQADAMGLPIIDTSEDPVERSLEILVDLVRNLRDRAAA